MECHTKEIKLKPPHSQQYLLIKSTQHAKQTYGAILSIKFPFFYGYSIEFPTLFKRKIVQVFLILKACTP